MIYTNGGVRLPFTLATDRGTSRLNQDRWKTGGYIDSTKVLNGLLSAVEVTYPTSKVEIDKHCVNLLTSVAATSESDGIGFDVVPCFLLHPDGGGEGFYLVPDGKSGWIRSNPRKDAALNIQLHEFHGPSYRKAVRLAKYWNKTQLSDSFSSYYIELAVSKHFLNFKNVNIRHPYICDAFAEAMTALHTAYVNGNIPSLIAEAPSVEIPMLNAGQSAILGTDAQNARVAVGQAFIDGQSDAAFATMNALFTTEFF